MTSAENICDLDRQKRTLAPMESESEIESFVLRSTIGSDNNNNNKDIYDLIDQIHSLTTNIGDFKAEIIDDLTECVGLYVDRFAMDKFQQKNRNIN